MKPNNRESGFPSAMISFFLLGWLANSDDAEGRYLLDDLSQRAKNPCWRKFLDLMEVFARDTDV